MSKRHIAPVVAVLAIFLSWFLISYLSSEPERLPSNKNLIIPFLWSCIFIYLYGKNHLYIAINSYVIFLLMLFADIVGFGNISVNGQIAYVFISIFAVFTFVFVYQNLFAKKPRLATVFSFLVTIILYTLPLIYIIYALNFNAFITKETIYAILQTDLNEALYFVIDNISFAWIGVALVLAFFVGYLLLKQEKEETFQIEKSLLMFMIVIFSSLSYLNKDHIRLYSFTENTISSYWNELALFNEIQKKLNNNQIQFSATKNETGETYLVVIGESLDKDHMGIYGYMRDTTPLLDKLDSENNLLIFDNAFSSHTQTMQVLSQSLTEANQLNKKDYYDSLSIVNILNKADIDTYWVTNHQLFGVWDNLVSVIAHQSDHLVALNLSVGKSQTFNTVKHDGEVIKEVSKILSKDNKNNRVIFVHLMGSHGHYCHRFPDEYKKFTGEIKASEFGEVSLKHKDNPRLNCYDNSVIYNDYVVSALIKTLQQQKTVNALFYFADHGEDALNLLHHNPSNFTYPMAQIPMIAWFSEQYKNKYRDSYNMLESHKNKLFSNDFIYDTLIGLFNVQTERYNAKYDLTSPQYSLEENNAYTLHGKISYVGKKNYRYHQKKNSNSLQKTHQGMRIVPHRVNSIGKVYNVLQDGYRTFELDVNYIEDDINIFVIGDNHDDMGEISFNKFLASIPESNIKKLWLDLKNLTQYNHEKVIQRLNYLDKQFNLKDRLIIESEITDSYFRKFSENGWRTSYDLPTDKIIKVLAENKENDVKNLANSIYEQSLLQKISVISFDQRLYPFVKNYLEPLLPRSIPYQIRDLSAKLYDKELLSYLSIKDYYLDERIESVVLPYQSPFDI